ncbi:MAG: hypothetical protein JRK53_16760 [Deltaproteobacteria bacterium]|nr:hypothetical protein [Deltaproteobacteria bacterium]
MEYTFRVCLNAVYLIKYLGGTMAYLNREFGFDRVFIMNVETRNPGRRGEARPGVMEKSVRSGSPRVRVIA